MAVVSPLPTTKLLPPRVPVRAIARPRLHELLSKGTASTLTLVSAPPGFGKTTLLAEWAARGRRLGPVCWVGVDEEDNARARMWQAIASAVAEGVPGLGELSGETGARTPLDTATLLINRVAQHDTPVVLILDDVHSLDDRSTLGDIAHLIKHAPPQLRIVLSTRSDPPFPLDRYRLSGQLVEIRAAELAMTVDETQDMLGDVADELTDAEIEALCERTEGWAAAIRLAAISLESTDDPHRFVADFAADDRAISDYLLNEVLDQQPEDLRTFLLRTSLPDQLTADLAADLSGRADAGAVLADLARRNLFLHRHGRRAGMYRYHSLFRSFLQAELMRERPDEARELHGVVASWCVDRGTVTQRIRHAIGAEDWPLTAEVATDAWAELAFLEPPGTIRKLVDTIPPQVRHSYQTLAVLEAIDHVQRGQREEGSARLSDAATASDPSSESLLTVGRMALARIDGDMEALERRSRELLEQGTTSAASGQPARRALRTTALSHLGTSLLTRGEVDLAEAHLEEALELAVANDAHFAYLNSVSQLALLQAVRGRLAHSAELGTEAVEFASRHGWGDLLQTIGANLALGWAHFHWDDLVSAEAYFEHAGLGRAGRRRPLVARCLGASPRELPCGRRPRRGVEGAAAPPCGTRRAERDDGSGLSGGKVPGSCAEPARRAGRCRRGRSAARAGNRLVRRAGMPSRQARAGRRERRGGSRRDRSRDPARGPEVLPTPRGSSSGFWTVWRGESSASEPRPAPRSSRRWRSPPPTTIDGCSSALARPHASHSSSSSARAPRTARSSAS